VFALRHRWFRAACWNQRQTENFNLELYLFWANSSESQS